MKRLPLLLIAAVALVVLHTPVHAQSGFALKGHYIYNESAVEGAEEIPAENGFGIGAELVLPLGLGVGASAYTGGRISEFDAEGNTALLVGEANYFLKLPILPVSPYAGVHAGLGRYSRRELENNPEAPEIEDDIQQLGYQFGVRVQLSSLLGLDAQWRRVSTSLDSEQERDFTRDQVLVGITIF